MRREERKEAEGERMKSGRKTRHEVNKRGIQKNKEEEVEEEEEKAWRRCMRPALWHFFITSL